MYYLIFFSILAFFSFLEMEDKMNPTLKDRVYFFLFLLFWLTAGLRFETGVDWPGYTTFYTDIEGINNFDFQFSYLFKYSEFEFGYAVLNSIFRTITSNIQLLFLFIAFITNLMLFKSIKKYSDHIIVSLLIYYSTIYFVLDLSGIRQCIALNIFLISLDSIYKKEFLKYILLIILATLFHTTALFLIPMYFLLNRKFKNVVYIIFIIIGVLISFIQITWLLFIINSFTGFFQLDAITSKLISYSYRGDTRNFGIGFVFNILLFVFYLIKRNKLESNKMFTIFLNSYMMSFFFYYYTWELSEFSSRFRLYFFIANIFLLSYLIDIYNEKLKRHLLFLFIISFSIFYSRIYIFQMNEGIAYNPYQNYVIYELFDLNSTGYQRLDEFSRTFDSSNE